MGVFNFVFNLKEGRPSFLFFYVKKCIIFAVKIESIKYINNAKIFRTVMIRIDAITAVQDHGNTIYIYLNDVFFEVNISYVEFKNKLKLL